MPDILHQFVIKAPSNKIFEAFTTPTGLNSWWPLTSEGNPVVGNLYHFYFGPEYDWRAEVVACTKNKSLRWKFTKAMTDWVNTEVGFELLESQEGTIVRFFHRGWQEESEHFCISNYCWGQLLGGLKDYVETGAVIPFEKRN